MADAVAQGRASRRSTTPRPTTTASRSSRPTCCSRSSSTRTTTRRCWSTPATTRPDAAAVSRASRGAGAPGRRAGGRHRTPDAMPTRRTAHEPTTSCEMRGITKTFPGVKALQDVNLDGPPRRDPRDLRRERRRQVHADEGAVRGLPARHLRGRDRLRRRGRASSATSATASSAASSSSTRSSRCARTSRSPRTSSSATSRPRRGAHRLEPRPTPRPAELLDRVGLDENPVTPVVDLGVGKQQLVEIAKALSKEVKLLILDEPTAALNDDDSAHLLDLLREPAGRRASPRSSSRTSSTRSPRSPTRITIIRDGQTIETLDMRGRRGHRGPDHPRHGRPRPRAPLSRRTSRTSARRCCAIEDWTVHQPDQTATGSSSTTPTSRPRAARSSASPG